MKKVFLGILPVLLFTGCYPIYKTLKPEVEVTIVNEQNEPISNVKVILTTEVHPAKIEFQNDVKMTDQAGKATFKKQAEWKVESLMIHGVQYYDWSFCVAKEGYLTQEFIEVKQEQKLNIKLIKGKNPKREYKYFCA